MLAEISGNSLVSSVIPPLYGQPVTLFVFGGGTKEGAPSVGARRRAVICFTLTEDIPVWSNNSNLHSRVEIYCLLMARNF